MKIKIIINSKRFSGPEYPPFIVFKIYTNTHDGRTAKYINGKNTIKASTSVISTLNGQKISSNR